MDGVSVAVLSKTFSLVYIPTAVVTYTANGIEYRHFVSMQTGKFSGDVPLDLSKVATEGALAAKIDKELKLSRIVCKSIIYPFLVILLMLTLAFGIQTTIVLFWVGWLIAICLYFKFVPSGSPWLSFLMQRQPFLLRLWLNPPRQIAAHSIYNSPTMVDFQKTVKNAADNNLLDKFPFEQARPVIEVIANAFLGTTAPAGTTRRFKGTMFVAVCFGVTMLIGTIVCIRCASELNRAEERALLEQQHKELQAREEEARQKTLAKEEVARQETLAKEERNRKGAIAKAEQAKQLAERQKRTERGRQMLSNARYTDGRVGVSYLYPKDWQRQRRTKDDMSTWRGPANGTAYPPSMSFLFLRREDDSLDRIAEREFEKAKDNFTRNGGTTKLVEKEPFETAAGQKGIRLFTEGSCAQGRFYEEIYYIEDGANMLLAQCSLAASKWDDNSPVFGACMQSVQFNSPKGTKDYDVSDTTPENNSDITQSDALLNIGVTYYYDENYVKAASFFRKAADKGNMIGQLNLGICYMDGTGVEMNPTEAVQWYKASGKQGCTRAQVQLGTCYYHGIGVPKNLDLAEQCFRLATQNGDDDAQKLLNNLLEEKASTQQQNIPQGTQQERTPQSTRTIDQKTNGNDDNSLQQGSNTTFKKPRNTNTGGSRRIRRIGE